MAVRDLFDQMEREWERLQESLPGGPDDSGDNETEKTCAEINGENGDCPLNRKTCSGCKYN